MLFFVIFSVFCVALFGLSFSRERPKEASLRKRDHGVSWPGVFMEKRFFFVLHNLLPRVLERLTKTFHVENPLCLGR